MSFCRARDAPSSDAILARVGCSAGALRAGRAGRRHRTSRARTMRRSNSWRPRSALAAAGIADGVRGPARQPARRPRVGAAHDSRCAARLAAAGGSRGAACARARLIVANGGSTLLQAIACGAPASRCPLRRIRPSASAAASPPASRSPRRSTPRASCERRPRCCDDEPARAALAQRAAGLGLADGVEVALQALLGHLARARRSEGEAFHAERSAAGLRSRSAVVSAPHAQPGRRLCEAAGWQVRAERFPSGRYGLRTWERRALLRWADVVVLHQIKLSAHRGATVRRASAGAGYSTSTMPSTCASRAGWASRRTSRRGASRKFAATCRWVDVVAAGNDVLAGVARAAARAVAILPTSIDTAVLPADDGARPDDPPTIVWIGSPENLIYLEMIRPGAGAPHARAIPTLKMRVICSRVSGLARGQRRTRRRGARPPRPQSLAGGAHRRHAADRRCVVARQVRIQAAAVHGRRAALRGLAGRRQYRGGDRRRQRLSRRGRSMSGSAVWSS